jgi:hypothetical protein
MRIAVAALVSLLVPAAMAGEAGDRLPDLLYAGTAIDERAWFEEHCSSSDTEACFGLGLIDLIGTVEGLSQAFYRHGATTPQMPAAAMMLGLATEMPTGPANPDPEPLDYDGLRVILDDFVAGLDGAQASFEAAGENGNYVIAIDPLRVRFDINGDGERSEGETLAALLAPLGEWATVPTPDAPPPGTKRKTKGGATPDTTVGFDRADAVWFAGYTQVIASPVDFLLAHDFSELFEAAGHRVFPKAGLPMEDFSRGGMLMMDPETDTFIADMVATLHTADFPVADAERRAGVLARLQAITALSRQNWDAILAETDDDRELVPSPSQTSLVPDVEVTDEVVEAWLSTLDTVDDILAGELLVPHWRFARGFDLKLWFETAPETDIVLLFTGQGALPYLRDGPIADAQNFADGNRVFGDNWPTFAIWFN